MSIANPTVLRLGQYEHLWKYVFKTIRTCNIALSYYIPIAWEVYLKVQVIECLCIWYRVHTRHAQSYIHMPKNVWKFPRNIVSFLCPTIFICMPPPSKYIFWQPVSAQLQIWYRNQTTVVGFCMAALHMAAAACRVLPYNKHPFVCLNLTHTRGCAYMHMPSQHLSRMYIGPITQYYSSITVYMQVIKCCAHAMADDGAAAAHIMWGGQWGGG